MIPAPYGDWFPDADIDGTYGFELPDLLAVPPVAPPDGFAERWSAWFAEASAVPADPVLAQSGRVGDHDVSLVEFTAAGGLRLRGWVALPASGVPRIGIVHSHGYGGRDAVELDRVPADAAAIFPVARGLGSLNAGVGAPAVKDEHVLHGIGSVEEYVLGRCAVDLWHAGTALREVVDAWAGSDGPGTALPLYVVGESFGGGIGALALPWDDRVVGATLIVPSFGQYDVRLGLRCEGSGETVRQHVLRHPEAREVLRWFDASTAAGFTSVPVRVEAARWDTVVPPPGQFAVANAVALAAEAGRGAALELAVLPAGHAEYPGIGATRAAASAATHRHIDAARLDGLAPQGVDPALPNSARRE
ncbi:acetylxylan esterase [Agromyces sp. MMS24-K17]|uniref:acetylxylan esterase n=1 Tax=Agromyces sp. MMS24-K17 TaxID=3372850 RepID=UPI00375458DD